MGFQLSAAAPRLAQLRAPVRKPHHDRNRFNQGLTPAAGIAAADNGWNCGTFR
jgi:hypothetical protein